MTTPIVLCADDYGLSPGVSRGIRELLEMKRLSATSCMVVFPEFADDGVLLKRFVGKADIGLHLTLTSRRSLGSVAADMHLRRVRPSDLVEAVEDQLSKFVAVIGRPPDYIDGHQHVHLLPVVREAVVQVARRIGAYVRLTFEPIGLPMWHRPAPLEAAYLSVTGRPLVRLTRSAGVRTNRGFRGVRSFRETLPFGRLFRDMIAGAREGSIIMCHPGHPDTPLVQRDSVQAARAQEFNYFTSDAFPRDLRDAGLALARLSDIPGLSV